MNFRTPISLSTNDNQIDYTARLVLMGSCFAENISEKFSYYKFRNLVNPFGIIFNPFSIESSIERITQKNYFTEDAIFFHNDLWHCFEVHSELSNANKDELLATLNVIIDTAFLEFQNATTCIITYGTSWVYRNNESGKVVANCHKVPQKEFSKELLSIAQIEASIQRSCALLQEINPNCHFIFTISPVRHLKDGFVENQLSKSHLIAAIHNSRSATRNSNYFPSYEIMMDDLRDYRFYAEDMLHPNQVAIDYIWTIFKNTFISEGSFSLMKEIETIQKAFSHRPFNLQSEAHQKFLSNLERSIQQLQKLHPGLNLTF
ncbi:GSCFA domain-containing protein [Flavobacterium orientale]|uniref:GSCFA domain-containing protein n=1 Tax=Flavobacterium orientale TaxID=1756020 RepID=A0A916XVB0_9FLAO|nr:GSCFA domain-containing protein [Flavobacterium orientale]GGD14338.1 hypothetical protein GCM10011343_01780 [Flavobacterium orientale]